MDGTWKAAMESWLPFQNLSNCSCFRCERCGKICFSTFLLWLHYQICSHVWKKFLLFLKRWQLLGLGADFCGLCDIKASSLSRASIAWFCYSSKTIVAKRVILRYVCSSEPSHHFHSQPFQPLWLNQQILHRYQPSHVHFSQRPRTFNSIWKVWILNTCFLKIIIILIPPTQKGYVTNLFIISIIMNNKILCL